MLSHLHCGGHGRAGAAAWDETGRTIIQPRANTARGGTIGKQGAYHRGGPRLSSACGTCWTSPYLSLYRSNPQAVQGVLKVTAGSDVPWWTGHLLNTHRFVQHCGDKIISNSLHLVTGFALVAWLDQERTFRVHSDNLRQQTVFEILKALFYSLN